MSTSCSLSDLSSRTRSPAAGHPFYRIQVKTSESLGLPDVVIELGPANGALWRLDPNPFPAQEEIRSLSTGHRHAAPSSAGARCDKWRQPGRGLPAGLPQ